MWGRNRQTLMPRSRQHAKDKINGGAREKETGKKKEQK